MDDQAYKNHNGNSSVRDVTIATLERMNRVLDTCNSIEEKLDGAISRGPSQQNDVLNTIGAQLRDYEDGIRGNLKYIEDKMDAMEHRILDMQQGNARRLENIDTSIGILKFILTPATIIAFLIAIAEQVMKMH